jgi:hypothetical protein
VTRALAIVAAAALLGGCALNPFRHHREARAVVPPLPVVDATQPGAACRLDTLKVLEGRPGSAVLAAQALDLSGARIVRWMHPGDMVTMDFRADRLNIKLTRDNVVRTFACG